MTHGIKTALITGASSGIGYELSQLFAAAGFGVVLLARSEIKLRKMASEFHQRYGIAALALAKDLSEPAAPQQIYDDLAARSIAVDVLVNNAGFGAHGPFVESDVRETLDILQVNMVALTHLTRLFLPAMLARGSGHILNVGSTGSFAPTPLMAVYGASKAFVLSFSEALAEELRGAGVSVTALCPGVTHTGFQARAGVGNLRLMQGQMMSARQVAEIGYKALFSGQAVVTPGLWNQSLPLALRLLPRWVVRRVSRKLMEAA